MQIIHSSLPLLSIIIPIHNGKNEIERCLNSIYSQNIEQDLFEVICVDDASTDETCKILSQWAEKRKNLKVLRHETNKRQGGARNSGMDISRGKYISFIDHDDIYIPEGLKNIINSLSQYEKQNYGHLLDILMFDYIKSDDPHKQLNYSHNSTEIMPGYLFLSQQECSWYVWQYIYRKGYLHHTQRRFRENVLFEDSDFILGALAHAHRVKYFKEKLICYSVPGTRTGQTTTSDMQKLIGQRFLSTMAIKNEAEKFLPSASILYGKHHKSNPPESTIAEAVGGRNGGGRGGDKLHINHL